MQTFKDIEVIIIDDCSNIDCSNILQTFKSILNIKYIRSEKNRGCGESRNIGLQNSDSEYIMFCDSDDTFYSAFAIEELYLETVKENSDLLIGNFYEECVSDKDSKRSLVLHEQDVTWLFAKIYKTSLIKDNNILFPMSSANEDMAFNSLCIACAKELKMCDKVSYLWHSNPKSITRNKDGNFSFRGLKGFIENHIWAYNEKCKRNLENTEMALYQSVNAMIMMYAYYVNITRNQNKEELSEYVEWVRKFFIDVWDRLPECKYEIVCKTYFNVVNSNVSIFQLYIPNLTIYQFVQLFENKKGG